MYVIAVSTLRGVWKRFPDAEQPLKAWYEDSKREAWIQSAEIKVQYLSTNLSGLFVHELEPLIGKSNRVYEVLNRKRPLTLAMIRRLHKGLGIPDDVLIAEWAAG
jgi:antitoxin component HigA of HigAB toxin-antitoxin module